MQSPGREARRKIWSKVFGLLPNVHPMFLVWLGVGVSTFGISQGKLWLLIRAPQNPPYPNQTE